MQRTWGCPARLVMPRQRCWWYLDAIPFWTGVLDVLGSNWPWRTTCHPFTSSILAGEQRRATTHECPFGWSLVKSRAFRLATVFWRLDCSWMVIRATSLLHLDEITQNRQALGYFPNQKTLGCCLGPVGTSKWHSTQRNEFGFRSRTENTRPQIQEHLPPIATYVIISTRQASAINFVTPAFEER